MRNGRHDPTPAEWAEAFRAKALSAFRVAEANWNSHPNSAANRAYYAVFAAIQMRNGPSPRLPKDHRVLSTSEVLVRLGLDQRDGNDLEALYAMRHLADYSTRPVWPETALQCVESARRLLVRLGTDVE